MIRLWLFLTPLVSIALSYKEDDSLSDSFVSFREFVDDYSSHFCTGAVIEAEKFSILLPAHCLDARYAQYYPSKENHIYVRFALQFNTFLCVNVIFYPKDYGQNWMVWLTNWLGVKRWTNLRNTMEKGRIQKCWWSLRRTSERIYH